MEESAAQFLAFTRDKLIEELWPRTLRSLEGLTDEQIWWRPNEASNSIGNLLLHLNGNVRQWVLGSLGGLKDARDRDAEFRQREGIGGSALKAALAETLALVERVLGQLTNEDLLRSYRIQGYEVTGLTALYHVVEHFAMHYGQILYITKMIQGKDLGFYAHLAGSENPKM
jgi:uncharacterized damage-inducible protein DinB